MTEWKVSTQNKKCVEEHEIWQKDNMIIRRITGFRWGNWLVTTNDDNPPILNQDSGPGGNAVNMYDYFDENVENIELDFLNDGWYAEVIWPNDMSAEERKRLDNLWEEESYSSWEDDGWVNYETECWASGPLDIAQA